MFFYDIISARILIKKEFILKKEIKSGFVSVVGRPNSGKSTILNWLLGEKIAMVSHKANATRKRSSMIVMHEDNQIIFLDTPGLHQKDRALNQFMQEEALRALGDCDLTLFLAPVTDRLNDYEKFLNLTENNAPHIIILTKIDMVSNGKILEKLGEYSKYTDKFLSIIPMSVKNISLQKGLLNEIVKYLPVHPYFYDPEILTTQNMREIYKEFIRESIFQNTSDELPYSSDVIINKVQEGENIEKIFGTIVVESNSQKGMIIGKNGSTLKRIGTDGRKLIERLIEKKVFLKLSVSVMKGWSKNKQSLKEFGYE